MDIDFLDLVMLITMVIAFTLLLLTVILLALYEWYVPKRINLQLTEEQMNMWRFFKRGRSRRLWGEDLKPRGKPLYKRVHIGGFDLVLYENGILARFYGLGSLERRFLPYGMLRSISRADVMYDQKDYRGIDLQLETDDFETCVIFSRYHEMGEVFRILRERLGNIWSEVFRADVVQGVLDKVGLESINVKGDLYLPVMLRYSAYQSASSEGSR